MVILKRNNSRADLFAILNEFTASKQLKMNKSSRQENEQQNERAFTSNNDLSINSVIIDTKGITTKEFNEVQEDKDDKYKVRKLAEYLFL